MVELVARIKEIIQRAPGVKSFRLEVSGEINYKAGQFCCISLKTEVACKRYLSISSSPTEKGYIEFTKKITESDFSTALMTLKPGDFLNLQYPLGKFTLEGNEQGKIAFLSGGIGITPIRSMCRYIVDKNLGTDTILIYANRSVREIIFHEEFEEMQRVYPKLKLSHVLCEPAPNFKCTVGLINAQIIKNEAPDFLERKFYLCGPPSMVVAMEKILSEELALPKLNIITERFQGY